MIIIPIIEKQYENVNPLVPLYYKNRSRLPTVTDINIISDDLIVVLHRFSGKVYLIKIEYEIENDCMKMKNYIILDTLTIKYGNNQYQNEMLDRKDNRLYIITFTEYLVIVDIIDNKSLKQIKEINLSRKCCYHGLEINNNYLYVVPSVVKNTEMHIIKMSLDTHQIEKITTPEFKENTGKYRIKDISFLKNGKILLIILINNGKTRMTDLNHNDNGFIGLYDSNFILLDKYELKSVHFDSLAIYNNDFYITIEDDEGGFIYKGSINNEKNTIENLKKISVPNFPHGITINNNLLGFTSYSSESIYLSTINEINNMLHLDI
jgi:hypothetical protein